MATSGKWQGWINVKWKAGTPTTAWEEWKKIPGLVGAWSTQGPWDCTLWVDAKTPDDLEKFVWDHIRANKWVEATDTFWAKQWL
jgi:hypothetical protein